MASNTKVFDLFLSYNHKNEKIVQAIHKRISESWTVWIDTEQIKEGDSLFDKMSEGILFSKTVILFITKYYCKSENCKKELKFAFKKNKPILIVKLEDLENTENKLDPDIAAVEFIISDTVQFYAFKKPNTFDPWNENLFTKLMNSIKIFVPFSVKYVDKPTGNPNNHGLNALDQYLSTEPLKNSTYGNSAKILNQAKPIQEQQISEIVLDTSQTEKQELFKTTFQRSAKGPVSIAECSPDGKVIILENTSLNKHIIMTNWVLKRCVDNEPELTYKFPADFVLKANKVARIWARGHGKENVPTDLVNKDIENWGMGTSILTFVLSDQGDEKATYLQKLGMPLIK